MSTGALKGLAYEIWKDILAWSTLHTLAGVHKKTVRRMRQDLRKLATTVKLKIDSDMYEDILDELNELERQFLDEMTRRGQSTSDLVWRVPYASVVYAC